MDREDPLFPITTLYAIPVGALTLLLAAAVISRRAKSGISLGHGADTALHEAIRRHGNPTVNAPVFVVLLALAEAGGTPAVWLHATGAAFVSGRLVHAYGLDAGNAASPGRITGATVSFLATISCLVALARIAI